jgi:outer membrane lipoprotein carrier protein
MNGFWTSLATLCSLLVVVSTAAAEETDSCVDEAIDGVQKRYEVIVDLRAQFVQRARSVAFAGSASAGETVSRGSVTFAKPGKMRWSYTEPEPSVTVSDGETLWLYDPARAEVQRMTVSGGYLSGAAVQFLIGQGDVRRDFRISPVACTLDSAELELVPRADASYEKIRILIELASGEIRRTTVVDLLGNVTEVEFSDVQANQAPGDAVFVFDVPDGVQVIDLDAP